jgi:FkbM family methyltransferase
MKGYVIDGEKLEQDPKTGLWYRPSCGELFVIKEQTQYKNLDFKGKTVMDVGANIGSFVHLAKSNGAKAIFAYEPTPSTYLVLQINNYETRPCATTWNVALIGGDEIEVDLFLSKKYPSCHTTVPVRGRERTTVIAKNFWDVLNEIRPEVLKIDIEGAEYDFIFKERMPSFVEQIAMELHMKNKKQIELSKQVVKLFSDWHCQKPFKFNWHITTIVAHRNKPSELGSMGDQLRELEEK